MRSTRRKFMRDFSALGLVPMGSMSWLAASLPPRVTPFYRPDMNVERHSLTPVPIERVTIEDEFWGPKRVIWQQTTIRDCFHKFENDRGGALNNFDRVRDGLLGGHAGPPWYDGLIYEMIRGSSDFLLSHPDPELDRQLDGYIERIAAAAAKDPNGYLNTYTQLMEPTHRWGLNGGLQLYQHEVYNAGALVDAGVHHYRATKKTQLLAVGVKFANHMSEYMGPPPKKNIVPCHPLPEEALVGLYELFREEPNLKQKLSLPVDESKYLALAEFWIEDRGHNVGQPDWDKDWKEAEAFVRNQEYGDGRPSWGSYAQDDKPVFQQETIQGHAVRATLLCTGIAAAARINHREEYYDTALRLWENMVFKRMHITGGVGAFANEEKFGPDYVLPNDAYLETCAAVGAGFFHRNMNLAFGDARYADELERALYNGALAGVSLKGDTYFYENPLEAGTDRERWKWHECPCCPPMFLKLMGAMPGYIYALDEESVYLNLFVGSRASLSMKQNTVVVKQTTGYPWNGNVRISVEPSQATAFAMMLRIPGWCPQATLKVNGEPVPIERLRGYAKVTRTWKSGDAIDLALSMPVQRMKANPLVEADGGKVAIMRGPLVYCLESVENGDKVRTLTLPAQTMVSSEYRPELLGGVVVVTGRGATAAPSAWQNSLYLPAKASDSGATDFKAIPYYANSNRGPVQMTVWLPERG